MLYGLEIQKLTSNVIGILIFLRGGGVQGNIFGRISFELWALQVPLVIGETFGEVPGPRRPTVSEPRPAQKLGAK